MKIDFLKDVALIVAGKNTGQIVELLFNKKNVNEFLIAKKLNLTINQTRNILYKLSDEGLVSFTRKKDKRKGWYTYFWTFNIEKALLFLQKSLIKEIEQLEHQLKSRQVKRFYICKTCNSEISEENALLHNFTCLECGEVYELNDNKKSLNDLNSSINKLRKQLDEINSELEIIDKDKRKKLERELLTKKKKAKEERQKNAKLRAKINLKVKKKLVKISKKNFKKKISKKKK
ncbi:MAG TPA: hypothetical protein P5277_04205 [Candidatus Paceibacterota bacterium]|nr:hypothetical protein [Candidatus Paceibacterota bacterium]